MTNTKLIYITYSDFAYYALCSSSIPVSTNTIVVRFGLFDKKILSPIIINNSIEIPFNCEEVKKLCNGWKIFYGCDIEPSINNNEIVIYYKNEEYSFSSYEDFFVISKKHFF